MITVVPFETAHLDQIDLHGRETALGFFQKVDGLEDLGPSGTFICEGKVVMCAGVISLWPGVAEGWALTSRDARRSGVTLTRQARRLIEMAARAKGYRRVQMAVRADYAQGRRWAEALGFVSEGIMRAYGPDGADHVRYARIFEK